VVRVFHFPDWRLSGGPFSRAILILRSIKTSAGIAGKDIRAVREVWPETAIRLSHRSWAFAEVSDPP
jgi:hypothetical protein